MSTAEAAAPPAPAARSPVRSWLRLFGAELRLVFLRKRNMLLLAVTVVFPVVIGIALRVAVPHPRGGGNGPGAGKSNATGHSSTTATGGPSRSSILSRLCAWRALLAL